MQTPFPGIDPSDIKLPLTPGGDDLMEQDDTLTARKAFPDGYYSDVQGNVVVNVQVDPATVVRQVSVPVSGRIGDPLPNVFTRQLGHRIQSITGMRSTVPGITRFTGQGTTVLVVEVYPSGSADAPYSGTASCTVLLE